MATLPTPKITWIPGADVGNTVVGPAQQFFFHTKAPDGRTLMRPVFLLPFLDSINKVVIDAKKVLDNGTWTEIERQRMTTDIGKWNANYTVYREYLVDNIDLDSDKPEDYTEIAAIVLDPLIMGRFHIKHDDGPTTFTNKPPDMATPFIIANSTKAGADHFKWRKDQLAEDLKEAYGKLNPVSAVKEGWAGIKEDLGSASGLMVAGAVAVTVIAGATIVISAMSSRAPARMD